MTFKHGMFQTQKRGSGARYGPQKHSYGLYGPYMEQLQRPRWVPAPDLQRLVATGEP